MFSTVQKIAGWVSASGLVLAFMLMPARVLRADDFQGSHHLVPYDEPPINYSKTTANDPVARLQRLIDEGQVKLEYEPEHGYLRSVLKALRIPESSQGLVFSKTSLQRTLISPKTPRAIFFNDDIYIGWIPNSPLMEVSAVDPQLGGVFYTLEQEKVRRPKFVRNNQCLECHASAKSMGVPGHLLRSFDTAEDGAADTLSGPSLVTHRTPMEERWGGWYVTGTHGPQTHRGNLFGKEALAQAVKDPGLRGNLTDLKPLVDLTDYLQPGSDIVALMVLEHQTHMHNFIARLHHESTIHLSQYHHVRYLNTMITAFCRYLLFTEEAPMTAPIAGTSGFATEFAALGPKDGQGRSLRELELQTRLFKHPCSFLIYSEAFDALPKELKDAIYAKLRAILTGEDASDDFRELSAESRRAVFEILLATKKDLPADWKL